MLAQIIWSRVHYVRNQWKVITYTFLLTKSYLIPKKNPSLKANLNNQAQKGLFH